VKMKKIRIVTIVVITSVIATLFAGCQSKLNQEKITIGAIIPLTGDAGSYGVALKKGMDVALEAINATGGIDGKKLAIVFEDSQADPAKAVAAFNKLRSIDSVPMVLGDMFSAGTLAIAPIAERNKIVLLSPSASAVDLTKAGDYVFRIYPSDTYDGTYLAEFARDKLRAKKVAVVFMQTASISTVVQVFHDKFEDVGGKVVCSEAYKEGDTDFRSQLAKAKAFNPDVMFIPGYLKEMANLLKQAKEIGIKTQFLSISTFSDPKILSLAGGAAEGVMFSSPAFDAESTTHEMQTFLQVFRKKFNAEPDILAGYGYDVVNIAAKALRAARNITPDSIKQRLYDIKDYPGVTGKTTFDSNGDVVKELRIMTVKNGTFVPAP
jgi:branched-chain amino acid transport system substrate-binding protein